MSTTFWLDPDEQRVVRAFMRPARALFAQLDQDLQREVGLPRSHFEILWFLNESPDRSLRMSDLAAATSSHPSGITHAVARLEEGGYVRRELCSEDRRVWHAVLTEHGHSMLAQAAPRYAASIRNHLLEPLNQTDRDHLVRVGEKLLRDLAVKGEVSPSPAREKKTPLRSSVAR